MIPFVGGSFCVCKPVFLRLMCQHAMRSRSLLVCSSVVTPAQNNRYGGLGRKEVLLFFILGGLSDELYLAVTNDISDHE